MEEKHSQRLVRDLFAHKDAIFSELKRMSTLSHSPSGSNRPRAISTDESNRKALMEERNRALLEKATANRGRATSPNPATRHRRDRSAGGPETRFPIQTSPTSAADRNRASMGSLGSLGGVKRSSLEVPDSDGKESLNGTDSTKTTEGDGTATPEKRDSFPRTSATATPEKRDSFPRTGARFVGGKRVPATPPQEPTPRGVTLEDKPMED